MNSYWKESEITYISKDSKLEGQLHFTGEVRIFGKIRGQIFGQMGCSIYLMETGEVEGSIQAPEIYLGGVLKGKANATDRLIVGKKAKIEGDLKSPVLQIDFGAWIDGSVHADPKNKK